MDDHDFGIRTLSAAAEHIEQQPAADLTNSEQANEQSGNVEQPQEGQRRVVSVIIDQDEEEEEDDEMNISGIPHDEQEEQTETLFGDHNYVVRVIDHPKPHDPRNFPTIDGLTIDEKDDYSRMRQPMNQQKGTGIQQQFDEQSGVPIVVYGNNGYPAKRQQKMMKTGGARYNAQSPQQYQQQAALSYSQQRQSLLTRSADQQQRSFSNLRPAASLGRGRANLDSSYASRIRIAHSLPPPQHRQSRQSGGEMIEKAIHGHEYEQQHFQQPAPIVAPSRGRPPMGAQRGAHNKNRRGRRGGRGGVAANYAPPPPVEPHYIYPSQRKPQTKRQNALQQKREQQKQRDLEMQMEEEEQANTFLEQEEQQNEEFFERQEGKKSLGGSVKRRPRASPKKGVTAATIAEKTVPPPADPTHPPQSSTTAPIDMDSSKPPDDPFLPPQQQMLLPLQPPSQCSSLVSSHSAIYDSSALDGTINAVIRGEASVMQQRFGPPLTPGGSYFPQNFQHQSPYKMSSQQQQVSGPYPTITTTSSPKGRKQAQQFDTSTLSSAAGGGLQFSTSLSHQRLNDLAELANASANLLEQTTSRVVSFQQQQQQQQKQFQPPNKTLHFKVVQTSHQDEPFDQQAFTHPPQQQVFMVQQRSDRYAQHISSSISQQSTTEMMGKREQRKSTKRTSGAILEEEQPEMVFGAELMPGTSEAAALMPIEEPIFKGMKKKGRKFNEQMMKEEGILMAEQQREMAPIEEAKPKQQQRERRKHKQKEEEKTLPYETRCICGMTHNDPFMIQCDRCDVWQHGLCMGISEKNVPDEYLCEQCQPRKLKNTSKAAANAQQRTLKLMEAQKRTKKIAANMKRKSAPAIIQQQKKKTPLAIRQGKVAKKSNLSATGASKLSKSFSMAHNNIEQGGLNGSSNIGGKALDFEETNENGYSRGVRSYSRQVHSMITKMQPFVLGEIGLLKQLEKVSKARPMLVTPQHKGLVATQGKTTMPPGMPIIEYVGQVSLLSEVKALALKKPINHEFTVIYSGLDERVLIDATKKGSMARFVRRSCRPNATMQHAIIDGKLRFYLYATTNIDNSTEITIPFDYDYRHESKVPIECACGQNVYMNGNQQYCPVVDFNKSLLAKEHSPQGRGCGVSPSTSARATRQASNAAGGIKGGNSPPKAAPGIAVVKEEVKSPPPETEGRQLRARNQPSKSEQTPPAPHGRATRSNTNMIEKSPEKEENVAATKRKSRELKPVTTSSSYSDFANTLPMPPVNFSQSHPMQAAGSGLTLAKSQRPTKASPQNSMSPTPRKRGRPSANQGKGEGKLTVPKVEITMTTLATAASENSNANLSREERKMQQTIDAYERAEQMKKRRSEDQQQIKIEPISPKKARISTKKSKSAPSTMAEIFKEFGEILRQKLVGVEKDFELPSEFNKIRAKLSEQSKTKQQQKEEKPPVPSKSTPSTLSIKKQSTKESPRKSAKSSSTVTVTTARVSKLQQRREREEAEAEAASKLKEAAIPIGLLGRSHQTAGIGTATTKQSKEAERPKEKSSKGTAAEEEDGKNIGTEEEQQKQQQLPEEMETKETTTESSSSQQQQLVAELAARVPNTKAQKKLTIEEYRRKKMADIEAKKGGNGGDGTATNIQSPRAASTSSSTTTESYSIIGSPPTRQSPRKSFIPVVGTGAALQTSSPQQLEDFAPITPTISGGNGGGGRRQLYSTPSLDELKKRILTSASSSSGASGGGAGSSSSARSTAAPADNKFAQQRHSTTSSSSHLPADPLPPPPPPQYPKRGTATAAAAAASAESAAERASLDDRLKRLVSTTKRGGGAGK